MKFKHIIYLFLISILNLGCLTTPLTFEGLDMDVLKLAKSNNNLINLNVDGNINSKLGNQYLFLVIPFGRIELETPKKRIMSTAYKSLSLLGYFPRLTKFKEIPNVPELKIEVNEISLSGFDLLIYRKISGRISVKATLSLPGKPSKSVVVLTEDSRFSRYAFKGELQRFLDRLLDQNITEVLDELRL